MEKNIINFTCAFMCALGIWFLVSFCDIVAHNLDPEPQYTSWNVINILAENF